ncbi:MAG: type II toxin-antitoxin system RelE/ParE family toxin [Rhodanobacteraceae bacterium]|nr:MAG: type II toxin-antitoxin system RelE/ParE family toxin [Rhodanobacteraceae bacterium]
MSVRLLEVAQHELDEAIAWYASQAPGLGDAFLLEAVSAFELIQRYPQAWHPFSDGIRRCRLRRFPYGVIYAAVDGDVLVLAVAHLHRRPDYWRERFKKPPDEPVTT